MRPQVKERDLSPQFSVERFIGILFIDIPIGIGTFGLENLLSIGLFWDPFCLFLDICLHHQQLCTACAQRLQLQFAHHGSPFPRLHGFISLVPLMLNLVARLSFKMQAGP